MQRATALALWLSSAVAAAGCDVFLPAMGGEGQRCFDNLTCKKDLLCVDGVCRARIEPDGGDGGDGADGADPSTGDDGGPDDADDGTDGGSDGDGFIPECTTGELRCQERTLRRCEAPGVWRDDHRCNIGCDAAGVDCLKVVDIAGGHSHTCAALSDGRVLCWGNNSDAQLGVGAIGGGTVPPSVVYTTALTPLFEARGVAAATKTSCAHLRDGSVSCWGQNDQGQCGVSPTGGVWSSAKAVPGLFGAQLIGGTWSTLAVLTEDNQVLRWGCSMRGDGCWGSPYFDANPTAVAGFEGARAVCLGGNHACALVTVRDSSEVRCFGDNDVGQLGNAALNGADSVSPVKVDGSDGWTGVGCANVASFAWGPGGAYSWGSSQGGGLLGDGQMGDYTRQTPGPLLLVDAFDRPLPIRSIRGGMRHACAEVEAGDGLVNIYCWGYSLHGQVGGPALGEGVYYLRPILVQNLPSVRKLGVGWEHNCVIMADDETVKCWGFNNQGCVNGKSSPGDISNPVLVEFP